MVLVAALLGTAAMWLQESDLQTTPARNEVTRVYESRDETAMLSLVGIDPATISPFPSFDHQIIQIQEPAMRDAIAASTGISAAVSITRSEQRFSLLDTVEGDGKTKFTFLSVGTPTYTFFCETESVDDCNTAIDAYVEQLQQLRQQSVVTGIERLQQLLGALPITTTAHADKIEALAAAKDLVKGELAVLSTTIVAEGPTISTVNSRTYIFGFLAGTIIGLLIALQLTLIDKRIRSMDQISRHVGQNNFIGSIISDPSTKQHVAAAIVARAKQLGLSSVVLAHASPECSTDDLAHEINLITRPLGVSVGMQESILTVDAQTILGNQDGVVIVATKKQTTITQAVDSWLVYESAQKQVLGLVLTD
jgi:Holliday junction resolvase-like predicted endonuclease